MRACRLAIALVAVAVCLFACTGHYTEPIGPPPDAPPLAIDAANACTGKLYDPCTVNTQCMSGDCRDYIGMGFSACTEPCTTPDTMSCPPDSTGVAGFCNMMGTCKPIKPNDCTL
jgi:hypothetical protein